MAQSEFRWTTTTMFERLNKMPVHVDRQIFGAMSASRGPMESHARLNAPWQDQTGNARNGLFAKYQGKEDGAHVLVLAHRVLYGIWLEVRFAGQYAIIMPTVRMFVPIVLARLRGMLAKQP